MSEKKENKPFKQPIEQSSFVESDNVDSNARLLHIPDEQDCSNEIEKQFLVFPSELINYAASLCIATAITATFFAVFFKFGQLSKALPNFSWETHFYLYCALFIQTAKLAVTGGLVALLIWNLLKEQKVTPILKWSLAAWAAFLSVLIYITPNLWTLEGWTQPLQIFITFCPGLFGGLLSIGIVHYKESFHLTKQKNSPKK